VGVEDSGQLRHGRGGAAAGHDPAGVNSVEKKGFFYFLIFIFLSGLTSGTQFCFFATSSNELCLCHLSTDMWALLSEIVSIHC
jgi:hypothetical protein